MALALKTANAVKIKLTTLVSVFLFIFVWVASANAQDAAAPFQGLRKSDEPVQIEADRLEVEDQKGIARLKGNVSVIQGTTALRARTVNVHYYSSKKKQAGSNGNIKRIVASGGVAVRSGDQEATASSMVYDTTTQMVTMSGNVIISQGPNLIQGCKLSVNMRTNAANLLPCGGTKKKKGKGRIKMILTPN